MRAAPGKALTVKTKATSEKKSVPAAQAEEGRSATIQSVDRAAAVLKVLASHPRGLSVIEIAAATGLDRTSVHRMVRTLVASELVESQGASYRLGAACLGLGAARLNTLNLREAALPYAVDFQQSVVRDRPAVVSLSAYSGDEVIIVDRIWTPSVPLNIIMGIGWHFAIDQVASGRAMLATMDDTRVEGILGTARKAKVESRLRAIRKRGGLEWGMGEVHAGVGTLAYPLTGPDGVAVGALVVAGLDFEADLREEAEIAQGLRRSAQTISRLLAASS